MNVMKASLHVILAGLLMSSVIVAQDRITRIITPPGLNEEGIPKSVIPAAKKRITREELNSQVQERKEKTTPLSEKLKPIQLDSDYRVFKSIYDQVLVVSHGKHHTILPKGCILHFPEFLKKEVFIGMKEETEPLLWPRFLSYYAGLVEGIEVNLDQVHNKGHFTAEQINHELSKQKILIAQYQGSPITCLAEFAPPEKTPSP